MILDLFRHKNNCVTFSEALGISQGLDEIFTVKKNIMWRPPSTEWAWLKLNVLEPTDLSTISISMTGEWDYLKIEISLNNIDWDLLHQVENTGLNSTSYKSSFKNVEFTFLKITVFNTKEFEIADILVEGEETYENDKIISILYQYFYEPKMIEFYPFFPQMVKYFFKMLETNYNNDYRIIPKDFRITIENDEVSFLSGSINEGMLGENAVISLDYND